MERCLLNCQDIWRFVTNRRFVVNGYQAHWGTSSSFVSGISQSAVPLIKVFFGLCKRFMSAISNSWANGWFETLRPEIYGISPLAVVLKARQLHRPSRFDRPSRILLHRSHGSVRRPLPFSPPFWASCQSDRCTQRCLLLKGNLCKYPVGVYSALSRDTRIYNDSFALMRSYLVFLNYWSANASFYMISSNILCSALLWFSVCTGGYAMRVSRWIWRVLAMFGQ